MKKNIIFLVLCLICFCIFFCISNTKNNDIRTVIKFSSWGSKSETDIIKSFIGKFEEINPDIKIDFIHIPQNYFQKIQLLFASGLEPDVVFINNQNIQMYINAGLLEDLTQYFNNIEEEFYEEALNCFKKEGKIYALPRDISNLVIYYNKDIFKQKNVKMPSKIKNIFELRELAKKVSDTKNFGINFEENPIFWLYYLSSNGGGIISDDIKKIIIDKPESIEALNLYSDMINKDRTIPSKAQVGSMTSAQMFINGKLAMYLSGRWMSPKFRKTINFDWDITEFPAANKVYIDASGWAVAKKSKHKKEAVEFIKFLSSKEAETEFAKEGLIVPANKKSILQESNEKPRSYIVFKTMLKNSKPTPVNENYAAIINIVKEKTENIFNGTKNANDAFNDETIKQMEELLK